MSGVEVNESEWLALGMFLEHGETTCLSPTAISKFTSVDYLCVNRETNKLVATDSAREGFAVWKATRQRNVYVSVGASSTPSAIKG